MKIYCLIWRSLCSRNYDILYYFSLCRTHCIGFYVKMLWVGKCSFWPTNFKTKRYPPCMLLECFVRVFLIILFTIHSFFVWKINDNDLTLINARKAYIQPYYNKIHNTHHWYWLITWHVNAIDWHFLFFYAQMIKFHLMYSLRAVHLCSLQ